mmetsp:Transcript_20945/g.17488  ORF Transcript_20945/g.17488 Transcript_20945/m.17488 type:complete len:113 (+) Transcript_20945:217-555(+)
MKKEQKSTKKLLSDHTCALRKSLLTLMDEVVEKDVGVARVNILAELGLCSWWRDEHYLAVEMFQKAVDATGYKTYERFLENGLPSSRPTRLASQNLSCSFVAMVQPLYTTPI